MCASLHHKVMKICLSQLLKIQSHMTRHYVGLLQLNGYAIKDELDLMAVNQVRELVNFRAIIVSPLVCQT